MAPATSSYRSAAMPACARLHQLQAHREKTASRVSICSQSRPNMLQKMSHQGKEDAQDYEGSERRGGHQVERTNGRRRPNGVGNTNDLRSGQSPHRLGLKRSNPRGSGRGQFSQALRSGQHHAQELPSVYPRVDHERTKSKLAARLLTRRESIGRLSA